MTQKEYQIKKLKEELEGVYQRMKEINFILSHSEKLKYSEVFFLKEEFKSLETREAKIKTKIKRREE